MRGKIWIEIVVIVDLKKIVLMMKKIMELSMIIIHVGKSLTRVLILSPRFNNP
jgi:hypothetical protein